MVKKTRWTTAKIAALYEKPFMDLLYQAHTVYQKSFPKKEIQLSTLLNIKTGGCPEDCAYCPQSAHYQTGLKKEPLMSVNYIIDKAKLAKANGATRFCMGAAWRDLPQKEMPKLIEIIKAIKGLELEVCVTFGMLNEIQAKELKQAGVDYYNHNLDTSPDYYQKIITTRHYEERLQTIQHVQNANMKTCCGGILGLGETRKDRIDFLHTLANLPEPPTSVPLNKLINIPGTPLENIPKIDSFEFIKTVAIARIILPSSFIRLSAGRLEMSEEMQAWCFFAGANSIHYGEKLLITPNANIDDDKALLEKLNLTAMIN